VNLGLGKGSYFVYFSDLGHEYVRINSGYRT
jgi:N-acetylglutamate synthase/N-acetylornithine aminotransferase